MYIKLNFKVAILGGLDASPTPIFWRRNSTPSHPPSTTIVGRPHHHYHPQPVIRPGLPQAVAQHPHIHGQGSHIHGQGLPGHIHGQGHIHSRPKPPLVG